MMLTTPDYKLLLVDDEVAFLKACTIALSLRGFDVEPTNNANAALELLESQHFDVAVLDIKMPGIDGVELFHRIFRRWPMLPVIMITGHGSVQQARQITRDGVFDYLSKPIDIEYLAYICRKAVEREPQHGRSKESVLDVEHRISVVIVDEKEEHLEGLAQILRQEKMSVATATSGIEAMACLAKKRFDVAIMDTEISDIDGLELLRDVKRGYPETEVIILTSHPTVMAALRGLQLGAFDYYVKPQDGESLARTIRAAYWKSYLNEKEESRSDHSSKFQA